MPGIFGRYVAKEDTLWKDCRPEGGNNGVGCFTSETFIRRHDPILGGINS
jgi:hypothetical protein